MKVDHFDTVAKCDSEIDRLARVIEKLDRYRPVPESDYYKKKKRSVVAHRTLMQTPQLFTQ